MTGGALAFQVSCGPLGNGVVGPAGTAAWGARPGGRGLLCMGLGAQKCGAQAGAHLLASGGALSGPAYFAPPHLRCYLFL